jgi:spermidine/putrescine transport system permease protein
MFKRKWLTAPYLAFILCGTVIPLIAILYYGFTDQEGSFTLENITAIADEEHAKALGLALLLALICTVVCLILAYPVGLILRKHASGKKGFVVFILILPMWMNFLLRTYAWKALLAGNGVLNNILGGLGIGKLNIINTPAAIIIGMVYNFLPYMALPLYVSISRIDHSIIEAAWDLGANRWQTFRHVMVPLSMPGIVSGCTMVFIPALTTFVISALLGGNKILLIGNIIEQEFTAAYDWQLGSALSMVLMVFIILNILLEAFT